MDVKETVVCAKKYISEIFSGEGIADLGLEEVEFDEVAHQWRVTLGFSRAWLANTPGWEGMMHRPSRKREYKMVMIDDETGKMISVKIRVTSEV